MNGITKDAGSQEQAIRRFLRDHLDKQKDGQTIGHILEELGGYYDADRAYIFELNEARTHTSNTFEWCREGVSAQIGNLQDIPLAGVECWFEAFEQKGEFYITSLAEDYGPETQTYRILEPQGVQSLMAAPIYLEREVVGFLGVDNPRRHTDHLLLLSVAASTCYAEVSAQRAMDTKLEWASQELSDRMRIVQSLGEIYTSLYYIDMASGRFSELTSVSSVHAHIGQDGDAQERLHYFCRYMMAEDCRDEMMEFVDLSTLDRRMQGTRMISRQYRSTLFADEENGSAETWRECSFIEADRDASGRLAHVIFTTQSIHEAKLRELEAQHRLRQTNDELTALLAAERQHTAIIGALSNIYCAL